MANNNSDLNKEDRSVDYVPDIEDWKVNREGDIIQPDQINSLVIPEGLNHVGPKYIDQQDYPEPDYETYDDTNNLVDELKKLRERILPLLDEITELEERLKTKLHTDLVEGSHGDGYDWYFDGDRDDVEFDEHWIRKWEEIYDYVFYSEFRRRKLEERKKQLEDYQRQCELWKEENQKKKNNGESPWKDGDNCLV